MGEQLLLAPAPIPIWALVASAITSPLMPRPIRFDDLVWIVRRSAPEADLCEIDKAARPFERGEPGAYTYELPAREEPV